MEELRIKGIQLGLTKGDKYIRKQEFFTNQVGISITPFIGEIYTNKGTEQNGNNP